MISYICVPSVNVYNPTNQTIKPGFLRTIAQLQEQNPHNVYVSMSLLGFSIVPYMSPDIDIGWSGWSNQCNHLMAVSDEAIVLTYPSWDQSIGVKAELDFFKNQGTSIIYVTPYLF